MPAGIVPDFMENVLHQHLSDDFSPVQTSDVILGGNHSLNRDVLEFKRALSGLGKMDPAVPFRDFMRVSVEMGGVGPYADVAPPAARRELVCRYHEGNARVASEYLGRADGQLFLEALPSADDPYETYPGLPVERAIEIGCRLWRLWRTAWHEKLQATEARLDSVEARVAQLEVEKQQVAAQLPELRLRRQLVRALSRAIPRPIRSWLQQSRTVRSLHDTIRG